MASMDLPAASAAPMAPPDDSWSSSGLSDSPTELAGDHPLDEELRAVSGEDKIPEHPCVDFNWQASDTCLMLTDLHGTRIEEALMCSDLSVSVELQPPALLYWAERSQWMWHKRWSLPRITVKVVRSEDTEARPRETPQHLTVMVTAGAGPDDGMCEEESSGDFWLEYQQGLGGDCQRTLELPLEPGAAAEASFKKLLFKQTSYWCGMRPLHLVVTVLATPAPAAGEAGDPAAPGDGATLEPLKSIACLYSPPVRVDARRRTKAERPTAAVDDVRFAHRPRGKLSGAALPGSSPKAGSDLLDESSSADAEPEQVAAAAQAAQDRSDGPSEEPMCCV